ncbi:MAG: autotransporter domain-containing protein, partial [Planctomycetes bacterium]|nr:autotransporter domain-containing protein [Planctomycetota bacterium]
TESPATAADGDTDNPPASDEDQAVPLAATVPDAATGTDATSENDSADESSSDNSALPDGDTTEAGDGAEAADGSTGDVPDDPTSEPVTEPVPEPAAPRYDPLPTNSWDRLAIERVDGRVTGDQSQADRNTFHQNMDRIWNPGRVGTDFTDTVYNLIAAEEPTITASGDAGALNEAVLGAFVDGKGAAVEGHGVVDDAVYEFYSGGSQWGVTNVALTTSVELMHSLNRRVDRVGAEMDRLGESWPEDVYGYSYASLGDCPPDRTKRVWGGAWGRDEEADFEYGIAGYRYKPRGALFGYDKTYGGFTVGGAFAYGRGDFVDRVVDSSSSDITSYSGGVYVSYHSETGLTLSVHAFYSHLQNDLRDRRGGMERVADHSAYSWSVGGRVGYDMVVGDVLTVSPTIGLAKIRAVANAHDESLAGIGVMRVGDVRRDALLLPLDLTFGFDLKRDADQILRLTGNIGYAYDFDSDGLSGTLQYNGLTGAGAIAVPNRQDGRNRFTLGGGFIYTNEKFDLGARYDFFRAAGHTSHQAQGSLGVKF